MKAVHIDAALQEIIVQGWVFESGPHLGCPMRTACALQPACCKSHADDVSCICGLTGGAVYDDILAATEPCDLALPWGVAVQTGNDDMLAEYCQHSLLWASWLHMHTQVSVASMKWCVSDQT